MANFRFNLDKRFLDKESSKKAKKLELEGKAFNKYLNPKETSIYLTVSINKRYIKVNIGEKILPKCFDVKNQKVKQNYAGALELNILMERIKTDCLKGYRQLVTNNPKISSHDVKEIMQNAINPVASCEKSFIELFEEFYEKHKLKIEERSSAKYKVTLKALKQYEKAHSKIRIEEVDCDFADDFSNFLIRTRNNTNNTITKHFRNIKCFMGHCLKNDLTDNVKFKEIRSSEDPADIFVLSWDELMKIYTLDLKDKKLTKVRDVFCFQAFTGQRYGDIQKLCWANIVEENGRLYWSLHQSKTRNTKAIKIPLMPLAVEILEKYRPLIKPEPHHSVFKPYCNSTANLHLKDIGFEAGLKGDLTIVRKQGIKRQITRLKQYQRLTTHCARKSFITLSIEKGMSLSAIQRVSGHTTVKAMRPYIKLSEKFVEEELFDAWVSS